MGDFENGYMKPVVNKGQLIRWNDERGFGFIQPESGEKKSSCTSLLYREVAAVPELGPRFV
jgi:hypothetical protein